MMLTGGRGYYMRPMTATLRKYQKFHAIGTLLHVVPKQCHIAIFQADNALWEYGQKSMAAHRDHVGCLRLCVNLGSKSSFLEWTRDGENAVRVLYSGPSFQVIGGIHSNFFDFGNVRHQSKNCDEESCRELIVLSFAMDPTKDLNITADSVASFVDMIKSL